MTVRKKVLVAMGAVLLFALGLVPPGFAGPVVIDGTDANDHGTVVDGVNNGGWLYMQKVLENLAGQLDPSIAKVVVNLGASPGNARDAIESAFALSSLPSLGWQLVNVDGPDAIEDWLERLFTSNTGILYIPTAGNTGADLTVEELEVINQNADLIADFVGGYCSPELGGGLFAMGESPGAALDAYGWLIELLPDVTVTDVGGGGIGTPLELTEEGQAALPGLTNADLSAGPWHNYYEGDLGGLEILATAIDEEGIQRTIIIGGGSATSFKRTHQQCITRPARFWFTHADGPSAECVTLLNAVLANRSRLNLGFERLPHYRTGDSEVDGLNATAEALGFYWRSQKRTGEYVGQQTARFKASKLCRERKRLAVEIIAATANIVYLGTCPNNCIDPVTQTSFPFDLLRQAIDINLGEDLLAIREMRMQLARYNASGVTNDFFNEGTEDLQVECSASVKKELKKLSRDPTTREGCPGINDICEAAESVIFAQANDPFAVATYKGKATLNRYFNNLPSPACAGGGAEAVWKVAPPVASEGRQFTVRTTKSNIDTVVSVYAGSCENLALINCATRDASGLFEQAEASFTTDGTNTYYIVIEGQQGEVGSLKVNISSP